MIAIFLVSVDLPVFITSELIAKFIAAAPLYSGERKAARL